MKRLLLWGTIVGLAGTAIGLVALFVYASTVKLPPDVLPAQTTVLYASDGTTRLASLDGGIDRTSARLDEVPPVVQQAVIAAEDRSFYRHKGVDPLGIARALLTDLRSKGSRQGGSTITQQYVKNAYVGRDRTAARKVREAVLAVKLEQKLSKDQILERYLNTIYFGRGAYGVKAASRVWFAKDISKVGPQEAAYLAALIRSPEGGDVDKNPAVALRRRDSVVDAMVATGALDEATAATVKATPITSYVVRRADRPPTVTNTDIGVEYWVDAVKSALVAAYGEKTVLAGGLRVTTTLDLTMQKAAYDTVYGSGRLALKPNEPAGAVVTIDDQGRVVAMVGGRGYDTSQVNLATGRGGGGSGRQPGSTFKPFLLAETVKLGYSVESAFPAPASVTLKGADQGKDYVVHNFNDEDFGGQRNLVDATKESINTVYAQLGQSIGPDKLVTMAHDLGVTSPLVPNASLVLGVDSVSPLEMAAAYSTFARGGERIPPRLVRKVVNAVGEVLDDGSYRSTRVLSDKQDSVVTWCLRQVTERGTGTAARVIGHPIAGKTGTTTNNTDAWFVGYSAAPSRLTTAVWMGWPDDGARSMDKVRAKPVNGGGLPAQLWSAYMSKALASVPAGDFGAKPDLGGTTVPKASGRDAATDQTTQPRAQLASTSTSGAGGSTTTSGPSGSTTTSSVVANTLPNRTSTTKSTATSAPPPPSTTAPTRPVDTTAAGPP